MAIDRSKFKGSSVSQMKQNDTNANKITGKGQRERADTLDIEEGRNRFRIYPVHPGDEKNGDAPEDAVFSETFSRVFLPIWSEEKEKDGTVIMEKGKPKMAMKQKPIFNSKLHGTSEFMEKVGKDLVEEYVRLAREYAEANIQDKDKKQAYLDKVYGKYNDDPKKRFPGCNYQNSSVMYADKLKDDGSVEKFGKLEVKTGVKNKMNKKAASESASDPLGVDPFSDVENGLPVIITFNKPQKNGPKIQPNDIYDVDIDKSFDKKTKMLIEYPLSDDQLDNFLKQTPLWKIFRNSFKKKDFALQFEGLQNFDEQYEIGIFESEEFTAIAEEISTYFADLDEEADTTATENTGDEDVDAEEETVEQDEFDMMSRVELQAYNRKMKLGVTIKPTMKDDDVRKAMREAQVEIPHVALPGEEGYVEEEKETPPPAAKKVEAKPAATTTGTSAKDKLAALRKK